MMPLNSLVALLAAGSWGMGDFSGGMSVKAAPADVPPMAAALRVILLSHAASFSVLLALSLTRHHSLPHGLPLFAGLLAGICGGISLCAFYIALSRGAMGASAAISGLLAAAVPAAYAIFHEGSPGPYRLLGFFVAALAIWLIAVNPAEPEARSTMPLASLAGFGFGLYFLALSFAGAGGLLWPLACARVGSLSTCLVVLLARGLLRRHSGRIVVSRRMWIWILSTALFDTGGNLLFLSSTRGGRLDVAAVLASLYPAGTILLAALVLGERLTRRQLAGMAVALAAVLLITL